MPASIVRRGALTLFLAGLVLSGMLCAPEARGAEEESATELAKKTQNPVADLISVPFQSNFNFGAGTKEETVFILNVQPVIVHLSHRDRLLGGYRQGIWRSASSLRPRAVVA